MPCLRLPMSLSVTPGPTESEAIWTCPFCPLLCDRVLPRARQGGAWFVAPAAGGPAIDCALADQALSARLQASAWSAPRLDGQAVPLGVALAEAARRLGDSRQLLLGGLNVDVAGARALHGLARRLGAITDAASGGVLAQVLRAQQDRGGYTTTLAEVRERADLIVCVGSWPTERLPQWWARVLDGRADDAPTLLALGAPDAPAQLTLAGGSWPVEAVRPAGDLFDSVQQLTAWVAGRSLPAPAPDLQALAARLRAARYAVLVWEPARLDQAPPAGHAGLLIERLHQLVGHLNSQGRAAACPLGGPAGAATAQQVFTWLDGLPLRSQAGPWGLAHEPWAWDSSRLAADGAVDGLLWVDCFQPALPPRLPGGTRVLMGVPALGEALAQAGDEAGTVFLPVATPGVHTAGHLFRADGVVMLPLHPVPQALAHGLPGVPELVRALRALLDDPASLSPTGASE